MPKMSAFSLRFSFPVSVVLFSAVASSFGAVLMLNYLVVQVSRAGQARVCKAAFIVRVCACSEVLLIR